MPSSIIHTHCKTCGKLATVHHEKRIGDLIKLVTYNCGHIHTEKIIKETDFYKTYVSNCGKTLYEFQIAGCHFLERSGFIALLADEMGLGKTGQALVPIKFHPKELTPFMILCKSGLRIQMMKSVLDWLGDEYFPQVIDGTDNYFIPGVKGYILSLDLLRRIRNGKKTRAERFKHLANEVLDMEIAPTCNCGHSVDDHESPLDQPQYSPHCTKCLCRSFVRKEDTDDELSKLIKKLGIKYVILDECQLIKNNESQRTSAVRSITKNVEHIVALSGTPIKNNAGEYFPILNILKPEKFPRKSHFEYQWVDSYWDGYKYKVGGLRDPERFKSFTEEFILRRTRSDVLPDLPQISRNFTFHELGDEVEQMYSQKQKQFQDEYFYGEGSAFEKYSNLLAYLAEMRHLTGMAKIEPCLDFVTEFLLETSRKLTIFVHHIDVATSLELKINRMLEDDGFGYKVLRLEGGMDAIKKDEVVTKFMDGKQRVLIASTLASGEGLNLQQCSDCIMLERQWNPANEEQAECRFIRIGQLADKVTATYFIAVGTVDEFFTELVEKKRAIVSNTLDGESYAWNETDLMKELFEVLATKGGKKWGW